MGIELDEQAILACVRRGLDVVQADLNQGLAAFADGQFDFVVLSQTLQAVLDVERVLAEMLRVGRQGIVSFPNFGYWKLRQQLAEEGRAPRAGTLLGYNWYNTPNVRFLSHRRLRRLLPRQGHHASTSRSPWTRRPAARSTTTRTSTPTWRSW